MFNLDSIIQILIVSFVYVEISGIVYSIYTHRCLCHKAVTYHPWVEKIFRFWLWLTSGVHSKYKIAGHFIHHKYSDHPGDTQSPAVQGYMYMLVIRPLFYSLKVILFPFKNLKAIDRTDTIEMYELTKNKIDSGYEFKYASIGPLVFLLTNLVLFGIINGLLVVTLAVLISSFCMYVLGDSMTHMFGYTNYKLKDNSKNIFPIGILLAGEEFGNNHHAYAADAKFSRRWFEFDLGWMVICILKFFKLASVKHSR